MAAGNVEGAFFVKHPASFNVDPPSSGDESYVDLKLFVGICVVGPLNASRLQPDMPWYKDFSHDGITDLAR